MLVNFRGTESILLALSVATKAFVSGSAKRVNARCTKGHNQACLIRCIGKVRLADWM